MNKLTIIGNLTRDPELRTTSTGVNVCSFTVAVNRRQRSQGAEGQPEADFFRVSAWRQLGEICYTANDGSTRFSLEVTADDVEFLSSRSEDAAGYAPAAPAQPAAAPAADKGFEEVDDEDLPF